MGNSGVVLVTRLFGFLNGFGGYLIGFFFFFLIWIFGFSRILVGSGQWWRGGHGGGVVVFGLFGY